MVNKIENKICILIFLIYIHIFCIYFTDLPPRKIIGTVSPSTLILSEGNSAQIDCSVEEKPSDISVIWLKNNFALREIQSKLKVNR